MTITRMPEESPHEFWPRHCGSWTPWRYYLVFSATGTGEFQPAAFHRVAERHRTCTTTEYWEVRHYSQECHSVPVCGLNPLYNDQDVLAQPGTPAYYHDAWLHEHNGRCCRWDDGGWVGCRSPEAYRAVCAPRVLESTDRLEREHSEVERQHWVEVPDWASIDRYPPGVTQRFDDIFKVGQGLDAGRRKSGGPLDLPQITMSPVTRGVSISLGLSGLMAIEGIEQYDLIVDGEHLAPEGPIETEGLRPGDHFVSLVASGPRGEVRSSFVLSVEEPVGLDFPDDRLSLKFGPARRIRSITATAVLTNRTQDEQSVTVSVLSSPPGWSAHVVGTRSFVLGANERQEVPIRLAITHPVAVAGAVSTFVVAARLNRSGDRSRDIVATVAVSVIATPELKRLGAAFAKGAERRVGDTETAIFDADVAMAMRPAWANDTLGLEAGPAD